MIATREEDPRRMAREQIYSLRRILIRRLQGITKGVSRRERVLRMRRFAEEWQDLSTTNGFQDLLQTLATSRTEPRSPGPKEAMFLRSLALATEAPCLSSPAPAIHEPASAVGGAGVEDSLTVRSVSEDSRPVVGEGTGSGQWDLFPPLVSNLS